MQYKTNKFDGIYYNSHEPKHGRIINLNTMHKKNNWHSESNLKILDQEFTLQI